MFPRKQVSDIVESRDKRAIERRSRLLEIVEKANSKKASAKVSSCTESSPKQSELSREVDDSVVSVAELSPKTVDLSESSVDTASKTSLSTAMESYDWNKLDRFAKYMEEQEASRARRERQESERQIRSDLDNQMRDVKARKDREKQENVEYYKSLTTEIAQWREYDQRVSEDRRWKAQLERNDRDAQLEFEAEKKKDAEKKKQMEDKMLLDRIDAELKEEARENVEKKKRDKLLIRDLMKENDLNRQRKQESKKAQEAQDLQQLHEYNELIERQERERQAELSQRVERQKLLIKRMEENVMKKIHEKSNDDNVRALKQQAERDARSIEIEAYKQKRMGELQSEMKETLRKQVEEKEARKKEEAELRDLHANILKLDSQEYLKSEDERRKLRKRLVSAYRQQLDAQMNSVNLRRTADRDEMSKGEIAMNKDLISVVEKALSDQRNS